MIRSRFVAGFLATSLLAGASVARAGSPVSGNRKATLHTVCATGPQRGQACTSDAQCGRGACIPSFPREYGRAFPVELTLIVDDDTTKFDGTSSVSGAVSATLLLSFKVKGRVQLLAQTYQNLDGATLQDLVTNLQNAPVLADQNGSNQRTTEAGLVEAVNTAGILDDLLFEEADGQLAARLRQVFGVSGRPVIVQLPRDQRGVQLSDGLGDGTATVLRLTVQVRFAPS